MTIQGEQVRYCQLGSVASTMDFTQNLPSDTSFPWTLVSALEQTGGRGTHGRDWLSSKGKGLYFSLAPPLPETPESIEGLTIKTADVLIEAMNEYCESIVFTVKHPNDILVNGRKIAGILYESSLSGGAFTSLLLGVGINLDQAEDDFAEASLPDATSLKIESGYSPEPAHLLMSIMKRYIPMYNTITSSSIK